MKFSQVMLVVKNPPANAGNLILRGFDLWVGKIPWRRTWQPTSVFLLGQSHGQRMGYGPWGHRVGHDWSNLAQSSTHTGSPKMVRNFVSLVYYILSTLEPCLVQRKHSINIYWVNEWKNIWWLELQSVNLIWQSEMAALLISKRGFPVAQLVKNPSATQETLVPFLGWEDPLEKE